MLKLHRKTLRIDKYFQQVAGSKINLQKLVAFLCANIKLAKKEIGVKQILFAIIKKFT